MREDSQKIREDISSSGAEESKNRENTFEGYIGKGS